MDKGKGKELDRAVHLPQGVEGRLWSFRRAGRAWILRVMMIETIRMREWTGRAVVADDLRVGASAGQI